MGIFLQPRWIKHELVFPITKISLTTGILIEAPRNTMRQVDDDK